MEEEVAAVEDVVWVALFADDASAGSPYLAWLYRRRAAAAADGSETCVCGDEAGVAGVVYNCLIRGSEVAGCMAATAAIVNCDVVQARVCLEGCSRGGRRGGGERGGQPCQRSGFFGNDFVFCFVWVSSAGERCCPSALFD